ncbi:MAG: transposase [Isosphaeraceae bacterium]
MSIDSTDSAVPTAMRLPVAPCPPGYPAPHSDLAYAALSVLSGAYRLSKRQVSRLCSDLLGLTISLGMIAKLERITADVLEQPVSEMAEAVKAAGQLTSTRPAGEKAHLKAWLWVVVTTVGVVFRIVPLSGRCCRPDLLGEEPRPIIIGDRFPGYEWITLKSRQVAGRLRRDMQAMIDRDNDGAESVGSCSGNRTSCSSPGTRSATGPSGDRPSSRPSPG